MNIVIYRDNESKTSVYYLDVSLKKILGEQIQITYVDRHKLPHIMDDNVDLFILPGITGDDCAYYNHIQKASPAIKKCIQNGTVFLGICAGAYYAMTNIEYRKRDGSYKHRVSPLGLINGTAKGPVEGDGIPYDGNMEWDSCVARKIELSGHDSISGKEGRALYSCGPRFIPDKNSLYRVFGRYADHPEKPDALIMKSYGKGLVIASSSSPQYDGISMQFDMTLDELEASNNKLHQLARKFDDYNEEQRRVWQFILLTALKHIQNLAPKGAPVLQPTS